MDLLSLFDAFQVLQQWKCIHLYLLFLLVSTILEGFSQNISDVIHV